MSKWIRTMMLGDFAARLDNDELQDDVDRLRARLHRDSGTDRAQDRRIDELEADVDELRVIVAELTRLLVSSGALSADIVERMVRALESAGTAAPGGRAASSVGPGR